MIINILLILKKKEYLIILSNFFLILSLFLNISIRLVNANEPLEELKVIEEKIKNNKSIQKTLKEKEKKINTSIKKVEGALKSFEKEIKIYYTKKKNISTKMEIDKKKIDTLNYKLDHLEQVRENVLYNFIKEDIVKTEDKYLTILNFNVYKSSLRQSKKIKNSIKEIERVVSVNDDKLKEISSFIIKINNSFLAKSTLEASLQGENLITVIQKREKELENKAISKKALELKELIESLKKRSPQKGISKNYLLKDIESVLPISITNIEKIRTDKTKKGILLTLKQKSFIKTPLNGLVVYADSFKGYGKMIILDLGNNYHLIYSGLSSILCLVGDWVNTGNILGEVEMEYKNNDVYLEVRFKGKPVDPSNWFKS